MMVTGYRLQHTLRELSHVRDIASGQFDDSLRAFPGDEKDPPEVIMATYVAAEDRIARLQVVQAEYNLKVRVDVLGKRMTLSEAVKLIGGAGRAEKMWRTAALGPKRDRFGFERDERAAGAIVARRTVSAESAAVRAREAARRASALREAIQIGNATEIEFELDPALFE